MKSEPGWEDEMVNESSDEVKQKEISILGKELGEIYHALCNECFWVNLKWRKYVDLFGTSEKRLDILSKSAPNFFWVVQGSLWDDTLLHICRLTDKPKSRGRDNLTIKAIPPLINAEAFRQEVDNLIKHADEKVGFARDWRNRLIAHKDLLLKLERNPEPLQPASRLRVREAIEAICGVVNAVSLHYLDASIYFQPVEPPGGVHELLIHLNRSVIFEEKKHERIKNGQYLPEDLHDEALDID
jgi:hypothetical protein